jgi:hypothetical protein
MKYFNTFESRKHRREDPDLWHRALVKGDLQAFTEWFEKNKDSQKQMAWAVVLVARHGWEEIFDQLLTSPVYDKYAPPNMALQAAAYHKHHSIVKKILNDTRFELDDAAFEKALENTHSAADVNGTIILLKDPRSNPNVTNNALIEWAVSRKHYQLVDELLNDERLNVKHDNYSIIKRAILSKDKVLIKKALDFPGLDINDLITTSKSPAVIKKIADKYFGGDQKNFKVLKKFDVF